jgi:chromosome segregation ATPase
VHRETVAELAAVRGALHEREAQPDERARLRRAIRAQRAEIARLNKTVDAQQNRVHELAVARNEAAHEAGQQATAVLQLKHALADGERAAQQLQCDLASAERDRIGKAAPTIDDFLPAAAWRPTQFDAELASQISRISANRALQPASKLHSIYFGINAYLTQIIRATEATRDEAVSENQAIRTSVHEFLVNLSIRLSLQPIGFADFFSDNAAEKILGSVARQKTAHDVLRRSNEQLSAVIRRFYQLLELPQTDDPTVFVDHQNQLKISVNRQGDLLHARSAKCHELRERIGGIDKKWQGDRDRLQSRIQSLSDTVSALTARGEELTAANQTLKKELHALRSTHRDLQQNAEDARAALIEQHASQLSEALDSRAALEAQLRQQRSAMAGLAHSLSESSAAVNLLKKSIRAQRQAIAEKEDALAAARREAAEGEERLLVRV